MAHCQQNLWHAFGKGEALTIMTARSNKMAGRSESPELANAPFSCHRRNLPIFSPNLQIAPDLVLIGGMWRSCYLVLTVMIVLAGKNLCGAESAEVNLDYVAQRALERARQPFHSPRADCP